MRFNLFQLMQASARAEGLGVPAKGVSGRGYEGHYFWDAEIYVLPFLTHANPEWAKALLRARCDMLPAARRRAREVGHEGALFPWRTINGEEASAWYAAGTAQYHINADVAYGLHHYNRVSGDLGFLLEQGAEVLVETARFWMELGFFSERRDGQFCIHAVTGPDEYTTVVDDNAYTNLLARENLEVATRIIEWLAAADPVAHAALARELALTADEVEGWRRAAERMYVPRDEALGIVLQDERFLERKRWDFEGTPREKHPLLLHFHPLELYRHQVIKQTDVVLATYLVGHHVSDEEKRRTFDYYDPLTTGDSTLSACIQSVMASEVGYPEAALELLPRREHSRPRRPPRQHEGRHPRRLLRRHLARARGRLRRAARLRRRGALRPAAAGRVERPALPDRGARPADRGRHEARRHDLPAARGRRADDRALRRAGPAAPGRAGADALPSAA